MALVKRAPSSRSTNRPNRGCGRLLLPIFATLCGVVSILNIFLSEFLAERDSSVTTEVVVNVNGNDSPQHRISGLTCDSYGGPSEEDASEMVFWSDIPSDSRYRSPFYSSDNATKYLTFEPDQGGWNNLRMAMETVLVLAHATGRTLVMPPEADIYLLKKDKKKHKTSFSFNDFFHLDSIAVEHDGIEVITMDEFLRLNEGHLTHQKTEEFLAPPDGRTNWDGHHDLIPLFQYLRSVAYVPSWNPDKCVLGVPVGSRADDLGLLKVAHAVAMKDGKPDPWKEFVGKPTPVDAPVEERLREMIGGRNELCLYDTKAQKQPLIHLKVDRSDDSRLLTHFYAFIFFQDWKQDLFYKRFVRDHVRYLDEIMCAAARVVHAVREKAKKHGKGKNIDGLYNSMHVRRGDFQFKKTSIPADDLYNRSKGELEEGTTLYIATDERDKEFFKPLADHYNVLFLDNFKDKLGDINSNYYGMLDQLVASRGRVFYGTWWSTLTGYINRMRGYSSVKQKLDGHQNGTLQSYYFIPDDRKMEMRQFMSVRLPIYMREFPTSWRDIDKDIVDLHLSVE